MKVRTILGHIDCPTCGTKGGMRITADKNGDPFGYCEATCSQQMRIGGDRHRVAQFLARFPWAKAGAPAVTDTVTAPAPAAAKAPAAAPARPAAPAPAPAAPARRDPFADAIRMLGGQA